MAMMTASASSRRVPSIDPVVSDDPRRDAERAYVRGTATLAHYARLFRPFITAARRQRLTEAVAVEARERAGLIPTCQHRVRLAAQRIAAYPPGYPVPAEATSALEEAFAIVLTVPPPGGLLPDQANLRAGCAETLLVLGDETGDRMRHRLWTRSGQAWVMTGDVVHAASQHGMEPADADHFMGLKQGYFQQFIDDGEIRLTPMTDPETDQKAQIITYRDLAACIRPPDDVSEGQIWSQ